MRQHALALSESALKLVTRAAGHLPVERRAVFLQAVAARLGEGTPSFRAVEIAIEAALNVSVPAFLRDNVPKEEAKP
jgi:hypothetical protein